MAPRRVYTDEEKALVVATLTANGGIVKRTARDTGIPEQTVRDWKEEMAQGTLRATVRAALPAALDGFVGNATRVRDLALEELEAQILCGQVKGAVLVTAIGVLTDKIRLVQGLSTEKVEQVETASPAEIGEAVRAYLETTFLASTQREEEILDAEFTEHTPAELGPAS